MAYYQLFLNLVCGLLSAISKPIVCGLWSTISNPSLLPIISYLKTYFVVYDQLFLNLVCGLWSAISEPSLWPMISYCLDMIQWLDSIMIWIIIWFYHAFKLQYHHLKHMGVLKTLNPTPYLLQVRKNCILLHIKSDDTIINDNSIIQIVFKVVFQLSIW